MRINNLEKDLEFDKELFKYYPIVNLGGRFVRYNPDIHELEEGEAAFYFDFKERKIKEGIVEKVEHSDLMNYPIYTIAGKSHMNIRVWPKVDSNQANLSAQGSFGIIVDKSKASRTISMNITPFPKDSIFNHKLNLNYEK
jgi:hypothetical protein